MGCKELELKLRLIVERRLKQGFLIAPTAVIESLGMFQFGGGCLLMAADPQCFTVNAGAHALGIADYYDLEAGFEGWDRFEKSELYQVGARIRRDYCEFTE